MESVVNSVQANELLAAQIDWHHHNHGSRSTWLMPLQAVETSISEESVCWRPTLDDFLLT